jgi:hypothetical protein
VKYDINLELDQEQMTWFIFRLYGLWENSIMRGGEKEQEMFASVLRSVREQKEQQDKSEGVAGHVQLGHVVRSEVQGRTSEGFPGEVP